MRKRISTIIFVIIFLIGLSILLYPAVSEYVNERHSSRAIASYDKLVEELPEADYSKELQDAQAYNEYLAQFGNLSEAASTEKDREDSPYEDLLNTGGSGIMSIINIPGIAVELPVYHGTSEGVLQVAAGHYEGSSLPVGGESTHAIITGHRGLPSAKLFTDLDRLETGDVFYLKTLGEILEYQIDQIVTVLPSEVDGLSIEPGKDYVTLVTCTPYGINSHRLLVRGTRVPYVETEKEQQISRQEESTWNQEYLHAIIVGVEWTAVGIGVVLVLTGLYRLLFKSKKGGGKA